jgi:hypothetical protein
MAGFKVITEDHLPRSYARTLASFKDGGATVLGCVARRQLADALHGGHYRVADPRKATVNCGLSRLHALNEPLVV